MHRRGALAIAGLAAFLAALAAPLLAGNYRWTTSGPEPGFMFHILVDASDSNRLHVSAGLYGDLVFDTSDRGATWTQNAMLFTSAPFIQLPANPSFLYTVGFTGTASGIMRSSDGGDAWYSSSVGIPSDATISALVAAPSAPGLLFAFATGSPGRVFRSDDFASSWTLVSNGFSASYVGDVVVDPGNSGILYALASPSILKSTDGGVTWAPLPGAPNASRLIVDDRPPMTLYAAVADAGLSRSTDGGASWQPIHAGIDDQNVRDLALDPVDSQRLWAASTGGASGGGGIYVTTNGGQSWSPVDVGVPVNLATAVAVDPRNASVIYAAANQSSLRGQLFSSSDGGQTWTPANAGISGYYSYGVACDPSAGSGAYAISGAKVFRTDDAGNSWSLRGASSYALISLVQNPSDAQTLYGGYVSSGTAGVVASGDGGVTWNPTGSFAATNLYQVSISPSAPDRLLAAAFEGLFGTVDGGASWTPLLAAEMRSAAFDPADPSILYAGLWSSSPSGDGLLRSSDGGVTWAGPAGLPTAYVHTLDIAIPTSDPSRVYAAVGQTVYRSVDRGLSFAPASAGFSGFWPIRLAVDPSNPTTLIAGGQPNPGAAPSTPESAASLVFRSHDGGDRWMPVPSYFPAFSVLDVGIAADGRTLYATTLAGAFQFSRSFADVPDSDLFWSAVDAAAMNGVTVGCGSGNFCPTSATSRASVAAFLLRGKNGIVYAPPPATGTVFGDVPAGSLAADFIEELFHEGITSGCGGGDYCPSAPVTRAGMAVLVLKTLHGADFVPPPATGAVFADVPVGAFAADWIEELYHEGVSAGCGGGNYCPDASLTRAQASALVVRAFGLS